MSSSCHPKTGSVLQGELGAWIYSVVVSTVGVAPKGASVAYRDISDQQDSMELEPALIVCSS